MRLLVFGASGRTGSELVRLANSRSHTVTAFTRPGSVVDSSTVARVVVGDPTSAVDVAAALKDQEAVISCLGQRSNSDATLMRTASLAVVKAMQSSPVKRYIVVSQGLLFPDKNPVIGLLRLVLSKHVADSAAMEEIVRSSPCDWTIVRPPRLLQSSRVRGYRACIDARPRGPASMPRIDLAAYLLDSAQSREHVRTVVGVTAGS
jgi:uncharacterized protein YbjT (DUF2867 family)